MTKAKIFGGKAASSVRSGQFNRHDTAIALATGEGTEFGNKKFGQNLAGVCSGRYDFAMVSECSAAW
jgi:hypothetical protein